MGYDEMATDEAEKEAGILKLRGQLVSKASGIVLETNVGTNRNY